MSFLYQRFITYLDNLTRDPKAEAAERKRLKDLKSAQTKAIKRIGDEQTLIKKAQNTQSPGRPEEALRYSIFPEDAKDILDFLDNATKTVNNAQLGEDVNDFINDNFGDDYENYKVNAIYNTTVYPKAQGGRIGIWLIIRAIKQLIHDNDNLSSSELAVLQTIQDDVKVILKDTKYKKSTDWNPIIQDDLKNLDSYKNILEQPIDKVDKNSNEYKIIISLSPKIYNTIQKLLKNHGEVDFQDKEGDAFTGNITSATIQAKTLKENKTLDSFSITSLIYDTISNTFTVLLFLMFFFLLSLGSSFAVNLNVHKALPYKIFYMIFGLLFGLVVIPYVLLYRWWFLGKRPVYYGYIPLIPRFFVHPTVQFLLGWLTYRPDQTIASLEEWRNHKPLV